MTVQGMEEVQHPVKVIRSLYERRSDGYDEDFGVKHHFAAFVASGAQVGGDQF